MEATDATPTEFDPPEEGALRVYLGDDKKNLECRYYEEQVSYTVSKIAKVVNFF